MKGIDGKISYSDVIMVKMKTNTVVAVSPNPAGNMITVSGIAQPGELSIISSNGSTVLKRNVNTATANFDVSHLPAGLYVVRFINNNSSSSKKLLIKH